MQSMALIMGHRPCLGGRGPWTSTDVAGKLRFVSIWTSPPRAWWCRTSFDRGSTSYYFRHVSPERNRFLWPQEFRAVFRRDFVSPVEIILPQPSPVESLVAPTLQR